MCNRFPGPCKDCGTRVEAGAGYFEKVPGTTRQWRVRHVLCTAVARQAAGKALSRAQHTALHQIPAAAGERREASCDPATGRAFGERASAGEGV